jgi:hypothetical protein
MKFAASLGHAGALVRAFASFSFLFAAACGGSPDASAEAAATGHTASDDAPPVQETNSATIDEGASPRSTVPKPSATTNDGGTGGEGGNPAEATPPDPTTPEGTPAPPPPPKLYVPPECDADCKAHGIPAIIDAAARKYGLPRWFYFAIIRRESTFDRCKTQPESAPYKDWGRGLTQVTFPWYAGVPYPQHLASANNAQTEWRNNMGLGSSYGAWIDMANVTPIPSTPASESECRNNPKANDAYDPKTNIDRFSSGFAAPAYWLYRTPGESPAETLRKVAYHWHYGLWNSWTGAYPSDPRPYLTCATCYDTYVKQYKAPSEAEDGVYTGPACKPPYSDTGC